MFIIQISWFVQAEQKWPFKHLDQISSKNSGAFFIQNLGYFRHISIWDSFTLHTLILFVFGAARPFSGLFFRFLGLVLLTVKVMLVGVCCVAVYNTVEGESSSSQLSVALLSPPEKRLFHSSRCTKSLINTLKAAYSFRSTPYPVSYYFYY